MAPKKFAKTFTVDDEATDRIEQILAQLTPNDVSEFKGMNRPSAGALVTDSVAIRLPESGLLLSVKDEPHFASAL